MKVTEILTEIQEMIRKENEGSDVLLKLISSAESMDELIKLGKSLGHSNGRIEALMDLSDFIIKNDK